MSVALGVVMDPISSIKIHKDSTFAMLLEGQRRGWTLWYMEQDDLRLRDGRCLASMRMLEVRDDPNGWFTFGESRSQPLDALDVILMRKDPPFDMEYVYTTYLLEQAEQQGSMVVNRPAALRNANEKLFTAWFPEVCPPTLVSRRHADFVEFLDQQRDIIVKPLGGMGGTSIFRIQAGDTNRNVIIETLTSHGSQYAMG